MSGEFERLATNQLVRAARAIIRRGATAEALHELGAALGAYDSLMEQRDNEEQERAREDMEDTSPPF